MANKFARSNGDFNGPIWALTSGGVAGSTTAPTIGDNAVANTFTIQITGNVACDNIQSGVQYGGTTGGIFNVHDNLSSTIQISANISCDSASQCLNLSGSNNAIIYGNLSVPSAGVTALARAVQKSSSGSLIINGNLTVANGNAPQGALVDSGSGTTKIYGNVSSSSPHGGSNSPGIMKSGGGTLEVYGNVTGSGAAGNEGVKTTSSTGSVTVYGNLNGSTASALSNTSTGSVTVLGNVTGDSRGGAGITSTNAAANVRISGNLIGAPNGIPAVYAAAYTVNPVPYQTYIRYANNGTGVGSDAYLYHYTTDSLSAFSMPPVSAVRAGLQYADNTLTGTCQIPPVSSVAFGALVGNTTGTAAITGTMFWDSSIASLTAANSVGARLKNSATVESVGRILASFTN